jgi:ketosteroid isomerase-like protein
MNRTWMFHGGVSIVTTPASYRGSTSSAGKLADLVVQPYEFIATNDTVVALGHESARVTATGRTYHSDFAFVFRVRNGKFTAFRAYHNTDAMMRATAV